MASRSSGKGNAENSKHKVAKLRRNAGESRFARIRGTATVKITTDELMLMTRGHRMPKRKPPKV